MSYRRILIVLILFSVFPLGLDQLHAQDILYLKNGSVIKGTIVEIVPEKTVKIQTADGSMFVFSMTEVERITKEAKAQTKRDREEMEDQSEQMGPTNNELGGSGVTLFGGVSLPVGNFGEKSVSSGGGAGTGFTAGLDGYLAFAPAIAWITSAELSVNSLDVTTALQGTGISSDADPWILTWLLTGIKVFGKVSPNVELNCFGQAGLLYGISPEVRLTYGSQRATQSSGSAAAFGYGFGAGMTISRVSLSVRYLSGEPEYKASASGAGGSYSWTFTQNTSCILITGGIAF